MGVSYLKLPDETWKKCAIWNLWNFWKLKFFKLFKPIKPIIVGYLCETFKWDLKEDVFYEMFETWNFSNF